VRVTCPWSPSQCSSRGEAHLKETRAACTSRRHEQTSVSPLAFGRGVAADEISKYINYERKEKRKLVGNGRLLKKISLLLFHAGMRTYH